MKLSFLTINAHKGFSALNKRFALPELRDCIFAAGADIIFLQEVVGQNLRHAEKYFDWPLKPQHEYIAEKSGFSHAYGKNAVYTSGHHGNAILSRFPILHSEKVDISTNRMEKRGLLYARVRLPEGRPPLHCVCVHLGLLCVSRRRQFAKIREYLQRVVPDTEPMIVAGDFNEWRKNKKDELETRLMMKDCGLEVYGRKLRTFPSVLPALPLDRIYLRGFKVLKARVLNKGPWKNISDHAAFLAEAEYNWTPN
jgi:endonuclease/exonuclease/phosphatase family metal-dependent hydrolase